MNNNPLLRLEAFGQSIWMDFIRRGMISSGDLLRLIEHDDLLLTFTDGIPDARNNADESFGREYLRRLVNVGGASPDKLLEYIDEQAHQFIGAAKQFDDITLLAVKRNS